jgi:hypothetical protein
MRLLGPIQCAKERGGRWGRVSRCARGRLVYSVGMLRQHMRPKATCIYRLKPVLRSAKLVLWNEAEVEKSFTSLVSMPKSDQLFLRPCCVRNVASGASGASNDKGQRPTSPVRLSQHGTTTNPMWITPRSLVEVALRPITSLKVNIYMMKTIVIRTSLGE